MMAGVKRRRPASADHERHHHEAVSQSRKTSNGTTTPQTPSPSRSPEERPLCLPRSFAPDATLVLVGIRGSGKSTLAVIASSALSRQILDLELLFHQRHGKTVAQAKQDSGSAECSRLQSDLLQETLDQNPEQKIIVTSWLDHEVQETLRRFSTVYPVIHISREKFAIKSHLRLKDDTKVETLMRACRVFYKSCTNLEFFNLTETTPTSTDHSRTSFMTLKHTEKNFLKFLSRVYPSSTIQFIESPIPVLDADIIHRQHTYVVHLELDDVVRGRTSIPDAAVGADAVQIVARNCVLATLIDMAKAVGMVRRVTVLPIVVQFALADDVSESQLLEYQHAARHALRLAPDVLSIDLRIGDDALSQLMAARNGTKMMASRQSSESWSDASWLQSYLKAQRYEFDVIQFSRTSDTIEPTTTFTSLVSNSRIPLSIFNAGKRGRPSQCTNSIMTPVLPSSSSPSSVPSPSITAAEATRSLYASFVYEPMKLYVLGASVNYSMSPIMHTAGLSACGIPHVYQPVSTQTLEGVSHLISDEYFGGASVGLPFKVQVISMIDHLSEHARAIGAVNTLIPIRHLSSSSITSNILAHVNQSGPVLALYGENTDWIGVRACIHRGLSPANAVRPSSCGVIIGAGGMARAALYAMLRVGVKNVVVWNRTLANAEKLVRHFQEQIHSGVFGRNPSVETRFHIVSSVDEPWPAGFNLPTIIISCIPTHIIGSTPAPDFKAPDAWLGNPTGGVIIELGYKTLNTPLLEQARRAAGRGWVAMDGLDLLPQQGFAQFELFTGRQAPRGVMRAALLKNYSNDKGETNLPELNQRLLALGGSS